MGFKENLKQYREGLGITAKDFARLVGVRYTTYVNYENVGTEPKYETLIKIATALHVSIDDLLDYKPDKLNYWLKYLGERYDFFTSENGSEGTLAYWDEEDFSEGNPPTMTIDIEEEELTNLLDKAYKQGVASTDTMIKKVMRNNVLIAMYDKKLEEIEQYPPPPDEYLETIPAYYTKKLVPDYDSKEKTHIKVNRKISEESQKDKA